MREQPAGLATASWVKKHFYHCGADELRRELRKPLLGRSSECLECDCSEIRPACHWSSVFRVVGDVKALHRRHLPCKLLFYKLAGDIITCFIILQRAKVVRSKYCWEHEEKRGAAGANRAKEKSLFFPGGEWITHLSGPWRGERGLCLRGRVTVMVTIKVPLSWVGAV